MTGNLDRSLDEILDEKKKTRRNQRAKAGPVGGVRKRSARIEQNKKKVTPATTVPAKKSAGKDKTDTKIQVSNLPHDINDQMLREYFTQIVGPVKRCNINYKANGTSTGIATIEFNKPGHANVAFEQFNGRLVDNRPMKVEIIVDPSKVPLANRISGAPKAAPKPAAASNKPKPATNANGRANGAGGRNARRGGRGGAGGRKGSSGSGTKRTPKTVEELDQEMADYYKSAETAPAAPATAADAAAMEDL